MGKILTGACLPRVLSAQTASPRSLQFPSNFLWGCATASYQIEGAANEDGRTLSVWDTFSRKPGRVAHGDTGNVAEDSYHRYIEDIQLLKNLGAKVYRFSMSWSRVFPDATGKANQKGLDYYQRVVDELLKNDIEPHLTLFHWDLPQALPGGWQSRETPKGMAEYSAYVAKNFSDRVKHFFTTNEFVCFTDLSYKTGQFAPGLKLHDREVNQIRHHGVLAHGLSVQAIRANAKAGTQVGLAENATVFVPVMETPEHIEAARKATREGNAPFLSAVLEGKYTDRYLEKQGANAPEVEAGDMAAIGSALDFVGLNVYTPEYVKADGSRDGYVVLPRQASFPRMASPWLYVGPEVIYWAVRNGWAIEDTDRVMYLRNHLTHLQRAASEGYPIKGYFLWSLLDNFEWADGYGKRFGIHYVDFKTQKRTPKLSAEW